jgi:imidazolonepropionase-like amidohydrolase
MTSTYLITARRLVDGVSRKIIDYPSIVVENDLIKEVYSNGNVDKLNEHNYVQVDLDNATLLPGLIDSHVHITLGTTENYYEVVLEPDSVHLATGIINAKKALMAGITTLVDAGSRSFVAHDLRTLGRMGLFDFPNLLIAGRPLTITGGHFWFCNDNEADSVDEVRKKVRQFVKEDVDLIKIMASGGGSALQGSMGGPTASQIAYNRDELACVVEEAHKFGRIATAHCEAFDSIDNAVNAGVDVLAHCGFIRPDGTRDYDEIAVKAMAKNGQYYNPTLQTGSARWDSLKIKEKKCSLAVEEKDAFERLEYKFQRKYENLRRFVKQGVKIVAGSDATGLGNSTRLIRALEMMSEAGLKPMHVIHTATGIAAEALKIDDKVGAIKKGLKADIIAVEGNPSEDISILRDLCFCMKSGKIIKHVCSNPN